MDLNIWQIIALSILAGYAQYDGLHALTGIVKPVVIGTVTGIIIGDLQMGLYVGGTINLMALGIGNFGGASIPDYMSATMLGTVFAVTSGQGAEFGVALAVPIGVLLVQLDVLARFTNLFFQKKADKAFNNRKYEKIIIWNRLGVICWGMSRAIPVFIGITLGPDIITKIVDFMPIVLIDGMKTAGGLLPALGLAILLRYMPLNQNISYAIIGFFLSSYLNISILGISLVGIAIAILIFQIAESEVNNNQYILNNVENTNEVRGDE